MDVNGETGFLLLHRQPYVAVEGVWLTSRCSEFNESPDFGVLILVLRHACGGQLDGMNYKLKTRPREEISRHVDAFLVLDDKIKFQGEELQLSEGFALSFRAGGRRFVVHEEDKPSATQLFEEVASGPNHGSHFQEKWREVLLVILQKPGYIGDYRKATMGIHLGKDGPEAPFEVLGYCQGIHDEAKLLVRAGKSQHRSAAQNSFKPGEVFLHVGRHQAPGVQGVSPE